MSAAFIAICENPPVCALMSESCTILERVGPYLPEGEVVGTWARKRWPGYPLVRYMDGLPQEGGRVCSSDKEAERFPFYPTEFLGFVHTAAEDAEDKARRLGVPCLPPRPVRDVPDSNPVVAVCGACGIEVRRCMHYSCPRQDCPIQTQVTYG